MNPQLIEVRDAQGCVTSVGVMTRYGDQQFGVAMRVKYPTKAVPESLRRGLLEELRRDVEAEDRKAASRK